MSQDNILLITTDQQRFDTIQALGNSSIYTPHLNYPYTQGTAYTRCYADCPICVPSRTTLMTVLRGYESGVVTNATHAQVMGQATARRAALPAYQEKRRELFQKLLEHTSKTRPQALENGYFRTSSAPSRPGDVGFRWLGFHYHDFNYDVFH